MTGWVPCLYCTLALYRFSIKIDLSTPMNELIRLNSHQLTRDYWWPIREARIAESLKFPSATLVKLDRDKLEYSTVYEMGIYSLKFGKPGKEAFLEKSEKINRNDMFPAIFKDEELSTYRASFGQLNAEIEHFADANREATINLARLFFRAAIMADYRMGEEGRWRLKLPPTTIDYFHEALPPLLSGYPFEIFVSYLDMIAWNEDVKYQAPRENRKDYADLVGQYSFFSTQAHIAAAMADALPLAPLISALIRTRGVAPLEIDDAVTSLGFVIEN